MAIADLITLHNEVIDESKPLEIFHPIDTWKRKKITNFYAKELMVKIFDKGNLVYKSPSVLEIKEFSKNENKKMWPETLRFENPHTYYVDLSQKLWDKARVLHREAINN